MWMVMLGSVVLESVLLGLAMVGAGTLRPSTFLYYQMRN